MQLSTSSITFGACLQQSNVVPSKFITLKPLAGVLILSVESQLESEQKILRFLIEYDINSKPNQQTLPVPTLTILKTIRSLVPGRELTSSATEGKTIYKEEKGRRQLYGGKVFFMKNLMCERRTSLLFYPCRGTT